MGPSSMGTRRPRTLPCPWLGTLQCLVLRSCALNALPAAALASLTALTSLDLSNNFLPLLPSGLRFLKQLQVSGWVMHQCNAVVCYMRPSRQARQVGWR
jgi:hypothetical protein